MGNILSICIYIFVFLFSLFICFINQHYFEILVNNENGKIRITFKLIIIVAVIISLPVIIAALRGEAVGVDTADYIKNFIRIKQFDSFIVGYKTMKIEFLYYFLGYTLSHLFGDYRIYFAIIQIFTILPVIIIAIKKSSLYPTWLIMAVYYFMFYNDSLNAMRQYIAVGCLLLAFLFFEEKKVCKAGFLYLIATGFHNSALLIGFLFFALFQVLKSKKNKIYKILCLLILLFAFSYMKEIAEMLIRGGIVPERYFYYIKVFFLRTVESNWIIEDISLGALFEATIRILIIYILGLSSYKREYSNYLFMSIFGVSIYILCLIILNTSYGIRISIFFDYFYLLLIPWLGKGLGIRLRSWTFGIYTGEVILLLAYWFIHVAVLGSGGTIPYIIA